MSDKNYWIKYYSNHKKVNPPTKFAQFILNEFQPKNNLVELGCGNGRDSLFFASNNISTLGIDQCPNIVSELNNLNLEFAKFEIGDFTNLPISKRYDNIYSRFTLHSVSKIEASRTLNWAFKSLLKNGLLFIEVRSVKDEFFGQGEMVEENAWFTDHYRRFIRLEELSSELQDIGFEIILTNESTGLAPYKDEDPVVIRVVCKK